ncbi:MAG TPA: YicC/YloC family endoribonuclease [Treponemataceae bacterium]|nr:YicC/YloC family endoribonuclease [Treponemataceae bacterium]
MKSMTAYAIVEKQTAKNALSIEIKSYNSRYLDISIILPSFLNRLEAELKHLVHKTISRGKIEVFVRYKEMEPQIKVEINEPVLRAYDEAFSALAKKMGRKKEKLPMSFLLSLDSVLSNEKTIDIDLAKESLEAVLQEALELCVVDKKEKARIYKKNCLHKSPCLKKAYIYLRKIKKKWKRN